MHYNSIDEEIFPGYSGAIQGDHCIHPDALAHWVALNKDRKVILPKHIYYAVAGMWWENQLQ